MIQLICPCCAKAFEIKQSKYDYFKKLGKEKLITCSRECRVKHTSARKRHIYSPFLTLFYATHHNAKGLYCELELQDLKNLWEKQKGLCAYSGLPMYLPKYGNDRTKTPFKVSVDRIDSTLPYIKRNVHLVCSFINLGKNRYSDAQVKELIRQMKQPPQNGAAVESDYAI